MTGLGSLSLSRDIVRKAATRVGERATRRVVELAPASAADGAVARSAIPDGGRTLRAHSIIDWIERAIEARPGYLKRHRLNEDIHFPQAIWALDQGAGLYDGFRAGLEPGSAGPQLPAVVEPAIHGISTLLDGIGRVPAVSAPGGDRSGRRPTAGSLWGRARSLGRPLPAAGSEIAPVSARGRRRGSWVKSAGMSTAAQSRSTVMSISSASRSCTSAVCSIDCGRSRRKAARRMSSRSAGGYGGLAYYLAKLIPQLRIVIVDIPESLIFSSLYLSLSLLRRHSHLRESRGAGRHIPCRTRRVARFIPNYLFDGLLETGSQFDLAINTLSMSEMDAVAGRILLPGSGSFVVGRRDLFRAEPEQHADRAARRTGFNRAALWPPPRRSAVASSDR